MKRGGPEGGGGEIGGEAGGDGGGQPDAKRARPSAEEVRKVQSSHRLQCLLQSYDWKIHYYRRYD